MKALFTSSLLCLILTGCAFTRDYVSIDYETTREAKKIETAEKITVQVSVADVRDNKDRVGCKKNSYGIECANIVAENNIGQLVKKAISYELDRLGFGLQETGDAIVSLDLNLWKFYNDFKTGFFYCSSESEMIVTVKVHNSKKDLIFSKTYKEEGINPVVFIMKGYNAKVALEKALANTICKIMEDSSFIHSLLNAYNPIDKHQIVENSNQTPIEK